MKVLQVGGSDRHMIIHRVSRTQLRDDAIFCDAIDQIIQCLDSVGKHERQVTDVLLRPSDVPVLRHLLIEKALLSGLQFSVAHPKTTWAASAVEFGFLESNAGQIVSGFQIERILSSGVDIVQELRHPVVVVRDVLCLRLNWGNLRHYHVVAPLVVFSLLNC